MRRFSAGGIFLAVVLCLGLALPPGSLAEQPTLPQESQELPGKKKKKKKKPTSVNAVLTPSHVTWSTNGRVERTGLLALVKPAKGGRKITFQVKQGGGWRTWQKARTAKSGRAFAPIEVSGPMTRTYRVKVAKTKTYKPAKSGGRTLRVTPNTACSPRHRLVDPSPRGELSCLAARLDRWKASRVMGIGQQLNVSSKPWTTPLKGLPRDPAVIGFDLEELDKTTAYEHPFDAEVVADLIDRAHDGAVLSVTWHAKNPWTQEAYTDRRYVRLQDLLTRNPDRAIAHDRFWADWDAKIELLRRFQEGDADGDGLSDEGPCKCTPVVFRPLHEANGPFFWWGKQKPELYKKLWRKLQVRAWNAGVHNVLWMWSANRHTQHVAPPSKYRPPSIDAAGLDTYDPERAKRDRPDRLHLEGYRDLKPSSGRVALSEVGPHASKDGKWNPRVIESTVKKAGIRPLWAMLWFDDKGYREAGKKQLTSLTGGKDWLRSCNAPALCYPG